MLTRFRTIAAATAVGLILCALPQAARADFVQAPQSPFAVGNEEIEGIATGDLTGNGRSDVVAVNWGSFFGGHPSYSVLLAGPNGSLSLAPGSPVALPASETPYRVALADVNGDGKLDLIMTQEGKVTVRLGNGNGTFESTPVATLTAGPEPIALAAGNLNGDRYADIAVANYGSDNVSVFYSQGNGTFVQAPGSPYAVGSEPLSLSIGDLNGDGRGDIVTANRGAFFAGAFSVLLAQEDGSYAPAPDGSLEGEYQQTGVALGDFDGDGHLDIAGVASPNEVLPIYLGNGSGEFTESGSPPSIPTHLGEALAVADFNGDGLDDIAVPIGESNAVDVFTSEGGGRFGPGTSYSVEPGDYPRQIAIGDFNGDGKPDIVTANGSNLSVLLDAEPEMVVDPTEADFGTVPLATAAMPESVTIANEGLAPLRLGQIELGGADAGEFQLDDSANCASGTIAPGGSCVLEVGFEPTALGAREATLMVEQESGPPAEVELRGEGVPNPGGALEPSPFDFGVHPVGEGVGPTETFTLESTGTTPLHPESVTLEGPGADQFEVTSDGCTGEALEPGESCAVEVRFEPGSVGAKQAALVIESDAGTFETELSGEGAPDPGISMTPVESDFGTRQIGSGASPTKSFTVESTGATPLEPGTATLAGADPADFRISADGCAGKALIGGETCQIEVSFAPTAAGSRAAILDLPSNVGAVTSAALGGTGTEPSKPEEEKKQEPAQPEPTRQEPKKPEPAQQGSTPPPACVAPAVTGLAPYKVKVVGETPKELGLRARVTTGAPAQVEITATLTYGQGAGVRTVPLGQSTLSVGAAFVNYKVPLPKSLRAALPAGAKAKLGLRYRVKAGSAGCSASFGPVRTKTLATKVVWIAR